MLKAWKLVALLLVAGAGLSGCGGGSRPDYSPQSTPPEVSIDGAAPSYTSTPSITLRVNATDTQGVKGVYALCGTQRWSATKQEDGAWQVGITLPNTGTNTVLIWGEDLTSPTPNSGQGMSPPYQLSLTIVYDPTPPTITYDATYGSYADERTVSVVTDATGIAKIPAAYTIGPRLAIPLGGNIYKAATRLSGGSMSASELETTNAANIPVLRFSVPLNGGLPSGINPPTYQASVTCSGACADFADATGTLLRAVATSVDQALFDLPLSIETVPALAHVQGAATVAITLTITDAAGNKSTVPGFNFLFHVTGAPVAVAEDTQYPSARRSDSTYAYSLADKTYSAMWDASTWWPSHGGTGDVRLLRYIITNPTSTSVPIQLTYNQAAGGSWRAVETWTWTTAAISSQLSTDGFTFPNPFLTLAIKGTACSENLVQDNLLPSGCDTGYAHRLGDTTNRFVCLSSAPAAASGTTTDTRSTNVAELLPYRIAPELGGEERTPLTVGAGQWLLVPAAAGGVPGTLVVYVARSVASTRTLAFGALGTYAEWTRNGLSSCRVSRDTSVANALYTFAANQVSATINAASDQLYGSLIGSTHAYSDSDGLMGEDVQRINITFNRAPLATH